MPLLTPRGPLHTVDGFKLHLPCAGSRPSGTHVSHAFTASVSLWIAPPPLTLLTPGCPLKPPCRRCRRHQLFSSPRPLATAMETLCHDWFQIFFLAQSFRKFKLALNHLYCFPHAIHSSNDSHSVMSNSLQPRGLYSPWNSPGQNTGVGCLSLLRGSSWPRNWTQASRIAGRLFTNYSYYNKLPQNQGLKTTQIYYLTIMDVRSSKRVSLG